MKQLILILAGWLMLSLPFISMSQDENYDAVYQSLTKEYTWNEDNSVDLRVAKELKLQNYRSFHRLYGETFIVYNPEFQLLKIDKAYTVMADGRKIITPENAFNEVLPRAADHAPAFNQLREMVVTHTGLEIGATIFLDYRIHSRPGFFPAFMGSVMMAEEQPVQSLTVIIRVPLDKPLYFRLINGMIKPSEKVENNFRVYTWKMENLPVVESEKVQPEPSGIYPFLVFSSLDSYQPLVDFFFGQSAFNLQVNPQMAEFLKNLETENQTAPQRVFTIQESVVKEVNLFEIPDDLTGYRIRTPEEVWNSNGGTVAEKALLLTALLQRSGINAEPVLGFHGAEFDHTIGNLAPLDEWAVKTEIPGTGTVYLSVKQVNAFDLRVMDQQDVFMVLQKDRNFQIVHPEQDKTSLSLSGVFVISPELTLSGELSGAVSGRANPYLALLRSEDKLKHYISGWNASSKLTAIRFLELAAGKCSFTGNLDKVEVLKKDSNLYMFALPWYSTGIESWDASQLPSQRQNPVELPSGFSERYNLTIALPADLKLIIADQEIRINNQAGSFLFLVQQKGQTLQVRKEIKINENRIETNNYPYFRDLLESWSVWQTNNLLFMR